MEAYQEDLAYIHDVGFGWFAEGAAPGVLKILRRGGIDQGLVVDLGCGSGIWARHLVDAGFDVLGIDISPAMIEIARRRVPEAEFRTVSLFKAKLPPCVAITALGECCNYRFDNSNRFAALGRLFRRVHRALAPGGLFVFDVAEPGRGKGPPAKHAHGDDWAVLVEFEEDPHARRLTRRITTFRQVGKLYRRGRETHSLQLYRRTEVADELRRAGFRVRAARAYGRYRLHPACVGFVARKP